MELCDHGINVCYNILLYILLNELKQLFFKLNCESDWFDIFESLES